MNSSGSTTAPCPTGSTTCGDNCPVRECITALTSDTQAESLALGNGDVYWANNAGAYGSIVSCVADGCSAAGPTVISYPEILPSSIAVDRANVYWITETGAEAGDVWKCAVDSCASTLTMLAIGQAHPGGPHNLAVDATGVYWGTFPDDSSAGALIRSPINGGELTTVASNQAVPRSVVLDASNVYWINQGTDETNGSVMQCPKDDCVMPTVLAKEQALPLDLAVDQTSVYWTTYDGVTGTILKCAIGGCPAGPTVLATGQAFPTAIVIDATNVYWVNSGSENDFTYGGVMKCAADGCGGTPTTIVSGEFSPFLIAVDATSVYWTRSTQAAPGELVPSTSVMKATPK